MVRWTKVWLRQRQMVSNKLPLLSNTFSQQYITERDWERSGMINVHPLIEQAVGQVCPEETSSTDKLKSLLTWFSSGISSVEAETQRLQTMLDDNAKADPVTTYNRLNSVELDEMVSFTLMNEFGPSFAQKRCFPYLVNQVLSRLNSRHK